MKSESEGGTGGAESASGEHVGTVVEEAARLLGALNDWVGKANGKGGVNTRGLAEGLRAVGEGAGHGEDCHYCPVCRTMRMVRETSPDVREHLAAGIVSLAQAATAAMRHHATSGSEPDTARDSQPTRVDLDD